MRTSLIELTLIEQQLSKGEVSITEGSELSDKIRWQKKAYKLIRLLGRRSLKKELQSIEHKMMTRPEYTGFRDRVSKIFPSN